MNRFRLSVLCCLCVLACNQAPPPQAPPPTPPPAAPEPRGGAMLGLVVESLPQGPSPDEPGGVYEIRSLPANPKLDELAPATEAQAPGLEARSAEAFRAAEAKRDAALALTPPAYAGSGERADVDAFVRTSFGPWADQKHEAVEQAEKAYVAVLELEPQPSPRWIVAAGLRVGALWVGLAHEVREKSPYPAEWNQQGVIPNTEPPITYAEVLATYRGTIDQRTQPFINRGRVALEACARHAKRHHVDDAFARGCAAWIGEHPLAPPKP